MKIFYQTGTIILFLLFILNGAAAQKIQSKGDKEFYRFNYASALEEYLKMIDKKGADRNLTEKIATCYRMINNSEEAEKWYAALLKFPDADPIAHLYYGQALQSNGNYQEARNQFIKYGNLVPAEKAKAKALAKNCEQAMGWMANPIQVKIENIKSINSEYSEFSPFIYQKTLTYTTDRKFDNEIYSSKEIYGWTGTPFLSIAAAELDTNNIFLVKNEIKGLNNAYHNGPATFSKKGDTIFFTRTNKVKNAKKLVGKEASSGFINRLEIYSSVRQNGSWTTPMPFQHNNIKDYSVGHPALSPDGKTLYFVSDMPGTLGETDIFFCEKQTDGTWSTPKNAGETVNSITKEMFPYVSPKGILYFSSNGRGGLGGLDLFSAKGKGATWTAVENLRYPMNSPKDDFGIFYDSTGNGGFLSSNREGGMGSDDIYKFSNPTCVLAGLTLEILDNTEKPLEGVMVKMFKKGDTTNVIAFERTNEHDTKKICLRSYVPCATVINAVGTFHFNLQPGETYELKASKHGYFNYSTTIEAKCKSEDTINIAILLKKIELNKSIVLNDLFFDENEKLFVKKNIYYDLNKANIRYDAAVELNNLIDLLKENPLIKIELSSHTDSRATEDYNLKLSQKRAETAVNYIVSKGINPGTITAKGYGESKLINHCTDDAKCSEKEHQENRRTEIMVTEILEPATHKVGPYDTLESISKLYDIDVEKLRKLNNLEDDIIYTGDIIKLK